MGIRQGSFDSNNQDFIYVHLPACHSICLHTLDLKIDFTKHPRAFLLILCDKIQDWGRPAKESNREVIYLENIKNDEAEIPIINFIVAFSKKKGKKLYNYLSQRPVTSQKIKVKIININ